MHHGGVTGASAWVLGTDQPALQRHSGRLPALAFLHGAGGVNHVAMINAGHVVLLTHPRELSQHISVMVDR